jgi:2-polyprenyl-3-methyl-5-hydroxy-6-metoxy-1,4-benzoquinol methylase
MLRSVELSEFDVASQPGLREKLADIYHDFRQVQSGSQTTLREPDLVVERSNCPGCNATVEGSIQLFEKNNVCHAQCQNCELVYTRTTLTMTADSAQYDDNAFMRAYVKLKRHPLYAYLESAKASYLIERAQALRPTLRTVLDIGASTGAVMAAAATKGLIPYGIEPDSAMAEPLKETYQARFTNGYYPDDVPAAWPKFDLVTLFDVLEHMIDPLPFLQTIQSSLSPQGVLLIQVPNFNSLLVQLDGAKNSNFCVGHWQHFNLKTLTSLLARAGFQIIDAGNCISELDRIQSYSNEEIDVTVARLLGEKVDVSTPERLYAHGLGYKLFGVFAPLAS